MHDPNGLRRLTARRFQEWMWYEQVEPFGELRADYRAAQVVTMIHNVATKAEYQKKVEDFLLRFHVGGGDTPKEYKQTVEEQIHILNILAAAFSGPEA